MGILKDEKKADLARIKENCTKRMVDYVWATVAVPVLDKELKHVAKKTVRQNTKMINETLARVKNRLFLLWLRQFWDTWRANTVNAKAARLKRKADWENFQPQLKCKAFDPEAYITNSERVAKRLSDVHSVVGNAKLDLPLADFLRRRRSRVTRDAFRKWRLFVSKKKRKLDVQRLVLHRAEQQRNLAVSCALAEDRLNRRRQLHGEDEDQPSPRAKMPRLTMSWFNVEDEYFDETDKDGFFGGSPFGELTWAAQSQVWDEEEMAKEAKDMEEMKRELERKKEANVDLERRASELAENVQREKLRVQKLIALAQKQAKR